MGSTFTWCLASTTLKGSIRSSGFTGFMDFMGARDLFESTALILHKENTQFIIDGLNLRKNRVFEPTIDQFIQPAREARKPEGPAR